MDLHQRYSYVTKSDYDSVAGPDWPLFDEFVFHRAVPDFVYKEVDSMLARPSKFDHSAFCVLPFYGVEYPQNTACCLMPHGTNRHSVQTEMLDNIRPKACNKCWQLEDAGYKSDRHIKNETLEFLFQRSLVDILDDCQQKKTDIVHYKIDTNNVCNAACMTCSSHFSSTWAKIERKNGIIPKPIRQLKARHVDPKINYKTAKAIIFRGGEPFLSDTNFYILEQLLANNNDHCFVSFVTNGSSDLSVRQKNILAQFSNVNFCCSIDGIGSVFDYLRYPLHFENVQDNIKIWQDLGIAVSANFTVSNLNLLYYAETVEWFEKNKINFALNPVYNPSYFAITSLPKSVKQKILQLNPSIPFDIVNSHNQNDDKNFEQFKKEVQKQDKWKKTQLREYLPALADLVDL